MEKKYVDISSDLGEGFGAWKSGDGNDEEIIALISSANIATGFHAGDPSIMEKTVALAKKSNIGIGAHPGYRDLYGFGRRYIQANNEEIINDIVYQVGALSGFVKLHGLTMQHVKLHGALYMEMAKNAELSKLFVKAIQAINPKLRIFCMEGSETAKAANKINQPIVREFYADRHYDEMGDLVFIRDIPPMNSLDVAEKVLTACSKGQVKTVEGKWISISFDSICIHSDTPNALELIKETRKVLEHQGIIIKNNF